MGSYVQIQNYPKNPIPVLLSSFSKDYYNFRSKHFKHFHFKCWGAAENGGNFTRFIRNVNVDSWAQNVDSPVVASQLSALSLLPYLGFLYFITKSKSAPRLTLFGLYFLLAFVGAATIFLMRSHNMDKGALCDIIVECRLAARWAESLLMVTNLFIVLGLKRALQKTEDKSENTPSVTSQTKDEEKAVGQEIRSQTELVSSKLHASNWRTSRGSLCRYYLLVKSNSSPNDLLLLSRSPIFGLALRPNSFGRAGFGDGLSGGDAKCCCCCCRCWASPYFISISENERPDFRWAEGGGTTVTPINFCDGKLKWDSPSEYAIENKLEGNQ
ncbi:AdoMet-dependent rRNA methyltransferase SPB1 [Striga asiatica]|uniref:AdoMet-dependent rRNA methyltransferase SPB1 n=1 Tax=Striga asiatica TaxID=4170 RepID=A0A5A7PC94_STRAF|nr:AdoMet-dependent rRNA methyltransferase SPB1 [Striga asiatica]